MPDNVDIDLPNVDTHTGEVLDDYPTQEPISARAIGSSARLTRIDRALRGAVSFETGVEFETAFLEFQKRLPAAVVADKTNVFKNYTYSTLGAVLSAIRPLLNEHGFVLRSYVGQPYQIHAEPKKIVTIPVITEIMQAATGQYVAMGIYVPFDPNPQSMGASITYGRRYALLSLCQLATVDDDAAMARITNKIDDTAAADAVKAMVDAINKCSSKEDVRHCADQMSDQVHFLSEQSLQALREAYRKRMADLEGKL